MPQKRDWDDLARVDPFWAILTDPNRRYGRWDPEAFFETGEAHIERLMARASGLGVPRRREKALDFGCGVGRLTRALARRFDSCLGLDISEEMVARARELNASVPGCTFRVCGHDELAAMPETSFDLVATSIVLQHLPGPEAIARTVDGLFGKVREGGLLVFQVPSRIPWRHRVQLRRRAYGLLRACGIGENFLYRTLRLHPMRMSFIPEDRVLRLLDTAGAVTLDVERTAVAGHHSCTYYAVRR
jgi:SAM-dependent methyltransferase